MHVIRARNVHQALPEALYQIQRHGVKRDSRNGPVLKFPEPCTIVYEHPCERVVFWPEREANPTFHLLEALWMLAGRNDVQFVASLVPRMATFSDDGQTLNGAYGYRWRHHFRTPEGQVIDQIQTIAQALRLNRNCRRQVLSMWDGGHDLGLQSKDLPCNTHAYFSINDDGLLDMMVCNRSNDLVWGALGANAVHFSVLQEFMASLIGVGVGRYWQTSNNMHLYLEHHEKLMEELSPKAYPSQQYRETCPYESGRVKPSPLVPQGDANAWLREVEMFLDVGVAMGMRDPFVKRVAAPLAEAYALYRSAESPSGLTQALDRVGHCEAEDWRLAAQEWYERRLEKAKAKCADGYEFDPQKALQPGKMS